MQRDGRLAILGNADAAETLGFLQCRASQNRGRAAEEGCVPLVEPALDDAVKHFVLARHLVEGLQVALDRIRIEEEMRCLNEKQRRIIIEIYDSLEQKIPRRCM